MTVRPTSEVPVFLLAGGLGTRLKEETEFRPKPMVPIGEYPILWHVMRKYNKHGFRKFVVCSGFKADVIKSYFLNYDALRSDFTVNLKTHNVSFHSLDHEEDWDVTVAYTGENTMTGGRIARAAKRYLGDADDFAVTYGDGLTDADLGAEYAFHLEHGRAGTILGVNPPSRFGELKLQGDRLLEFEEKPEFREKWINGGFFFFKRNFLDYLSEEESCILEREPLGGLTRDGELMAYRHSGFWACMDTQRDRDHLISIVNSGNIPWL